MEVKYSLSQRRNSGIQMEDKVKSHEFGKKKCKVEEEGVEEKQEPGQLGGQGY